MALIIALNVVACIGIIVAVATPLVYAVLTQHHDVAAVRLAATRRSYRLRGMHRQARSARGPQPARCFDRDLATA
jgi:hypothetical protein